MKKKPNVVAIVEPEKLYEVDVTFRSGRTTTYFCNMEAVSVLVTMGRTTARSAGWFRHTVLEAGDVEQHDIVTTISSESIETIDLPEEWVDDQIAMEAVAQA